MEKIITSKGVLDINIPDDAKMDQSGEHYIVCPICSSTRKTEHRNEKKLAVNLMKTPHPWRCNHCGESGYIIDEAYMLRTKIKPILVNYDFMPISDPLVEWFWTERAISKQTLMDLDISSSMEGMRQDKVLPGEEDNKGQWINRRCINFKYKKDGMLINIKYRDKAKNFKMIADASKIFYNIDAIKNEKQIVIVEGEMDVLAYYEASVKNVISVPNGVAISPAEIEEFQKTGIFRNTLNLEYLDLCMEEFNRLETIILATDDDYPGQKLREELARRIGKNRCRFIRFSEFKKVDGSTCKDANDVLKSHGKNVLRSSVSNSYPFPISGVSTAREYLNKCEETFVNGVPKGFSTGYKSLDPHFTWMPGWLTMVNGYAGEGKSSMLFNLILISTVLYKWKWGMYCPENYPIVNIIDTLTEILVGDSTDKKWDATAWPRMSKERYIHAIKEHLDKYLFFVDNDDGYTPKELRDVKLSLIRQHGIKGFLTDPWKNLNHEMGGMNSDDYLRKELAAETRLTTRYELMNVICHHPPTPERSKDKTYAAPSYFELVGGQIWSASAYGMLCIHKHDRTSWQNTETEIHIQKMKDTRLAGIPTDRNNPVILKFDRRNQRFYERKDVVDIESPYIIYPFEDYLAATQNIFDGF